MPLGLLSGKMAKNKKNEKQCKEQNRLLRLDFFLHRVYTVYSLKMITRVRVDARHSFLFVCMSDTGTVYEKAEEGNVKKGNL